MSIKIIAELGVNHNGSVDLAKRLVDSAHASGADAVKFQTFSADRLASRTTPKVAYQLRTSDPQESHYAMLKALELSPEDHAVLKSHCENVGVVFCSTPYSREDAQFLDQLGVSFFKVASADIIDRPLHEFLAQSGKECLVATGMATLGEIEEVVRIYDRGGTRDHVVLLQCVSAYPADPGDVNLKAMEMLRAAFGCRVGYSDHTTSPYSAIAAAALGATVIEKHFTLDKNMKGPDHAASATPSEFKIMAEGVRTVERALGDGVKRVHPAEMEMRQVSRKSIVAGCDLRAGLVLQCQHLRLQRPGTGLSPMRYPELIGKKLRRNVRAGEGLLWTDLMPDESC